MVLARVEEDDTHKSAEDKKTFTISKADSTVSITSDLNKTYDGNAVTEPTVKKTGSSKDVVIKWYQKIDGNWKELSAAPTDAGEYGIIVNVEADDNYNEDSEEKVFTISKADSTVSIKSDLNKTYDGNAVTEPTIAKTGSSKDVVIKWYQKIDGNWKDISTAPTDVGEYKVVASVEADDNHKEASEEKVFTISKADSTVSIKSDLNKTYDGNAVTKPTVEKTGSSKGFTLTWYKKDGNDWSEINEAPTNAGSYKVVANVEEDNNYNAATAVHNFEISKAVPSVPEPGSYTIKQREVLSSIELPTGFAWEDGTQKANEAGEHTFKAIYTPEDTENYQSVEVDISVNVIPTPTSLNEVPTITANDIVITVGSEFNDEIALKDVTANDKEDGDLTDKIEVIDNTVDTSKVGTYTVTYKVTDSEGASVRKTVNVTVEEKKEEPTTPTNSDEGKNNNNSNSNSNNNNNDVTLNTEESSTSVKTGDNTKILPGTVATVVSVAGVIAALLFKRKRSK